MIHRYIIEATDEVNGFEEAIERLDREWGIEELEPCDDAISRQAVQDLTSELLSDYLYDEDRKKIEDMDAKIGELPSVTPQTKTGHWIGQKKIGFGEWKECIVPLKDGFVTKSCSCSECGEWLTASDEYACYGNYCPNCGAKMESNKKHRRIAYG